MTKQNNSDQLIVWGVFMTKFHLRRYDGASATIVSDSFDEALKAAGWQREDLLSYGWNQCGAIILDKREPADEEFPNKCYAV